MTQLTSHPVTLRQLQYAVAVADELSFRRAAARCHVAQPSLSAQIAELEAGLGPRLFERDRRTVLVTAAGEAVLARARRILVDVEDLRAAARALVDPLTGTVRIGVIPTIAPYLLPDLDPALRAAFPRLALVWSEERTEALVAALAAGALDAGIVALEADLGDLAHEEIGRDPFVMAAAKDHPLARVRRPVRLAELRGQDVLLLEDGHCLRDQALELCAAAGTRELGFRATSLATLTQMVAGGAGVTLLPRLAVDTENRRDALAIRRFAEPAPQRTIALAWRKHSALAEALRAIAAAARQSFPATIGRRAKV